MREVELKLEVTADAATALKGAPLLAPAPEVRLLRAIYYDTPDHALAAAGLSLRIRTSGEEAIQTVKADDTAAAGLFVRSEWERPVEAGKPILDDTTPVRAMLGDQADRIAPAFQVNVERRIWIVEHASAEIELVLDQGEIVAGARTALVHELELELKLGEAAALFGLARQLDAVAPLRLSVQSKAERGYGLTARKRSRVKAETITLREDMSAADAFQQIAQACVRQYRLNEDLLRKTRSAKALHQARVALRRLRSAFSIFKPLYKADPQAAALRGELRWLAGELGEARNLDVLVERTAAGALHDRFAAARETTYDQVEAVLDTARARAVLLDLVEWLVDGPWLHAPKTKARRDEPARHFAAKSLNKLRRKVKKRGRHLDTTDDETRHEVRKDAKKLRYASEFFAVLFDHKPARKRHKRFVSALAALQDELGHLNDLATAPEEMRKLGLEDDMQAKSLLDAGDKQALVTSAAQAHTKLIEAKRFWR